MIPFGFEPKTYCLEGSCSIQLSYGTKNQKVNLANCASTHNQIDCVGVAGFEPTTSWSQTKRDTGLRYTPKNTAEREGFEPSVPFPVRMFSKHVLSASQASLLAFKRVQKYDYLFKMPNLCLKKTNNYRSNEDTDLPGKLVLPISERST